MNRHPLFYFALRRVTLCCLASLTSFSIVKAEPLKVAYSDWPGWVVLDIAAKKDWFKQEGLDVQLMWYAYAPSMDPFSPGNTDAACTPNPHPFTTPSPATPSTALS